MGPAERGCMQTHLGPPVCKETTPAFMHAVAINTHVLLQRREEEWRRGEGEFSTNPLLLC